MNEVIAYLVVGFFAGIFYNVEMVYYQYRVNAMEGMIVSIFWPLYWIARLQQRIALLFLKML